MSFLDLSCAFDLVDHSILLSRLQGSFGITDTALLWFHSFLTHRTQHVCYGAIISYPMTTSCGVPQGSVLGPLFFILYTADLFRIVHHHGLSIHVYADDIQIYGSCTPSTVDNLAERMSLCLESLNSWFASNRLRLNGDKCKTMWFSSRRRKQAVHAPDPVRLSDQPLSMTTSVLCLGVLLDSEITFKKHVSKTVASCFAALRRIRTVRRSLPRPVLKTLVNSLVLSRLDYCISALGGIPSSQLQRLQAVLHASARMVFGATRFSAVTPLLRELQWLSVRARISFRQAVLVHHCRQGTAPSYLSSQLNFVSDQASRSKLRSARTPSVAVPFVRCATFGGRSFAASAARAWNDLPACITRERNLKTFKHLLKAHLLSKHYE